MGSFIDADTHVDECEDTWSYMPESLQEFAPRSLEFPTGEEPPWLGPTAPGNVSSGSDYSRFWFIDGQLYPRRIRSDERTGTMVGQRELRDVPARLRDMDDMGVATQVMYPTVFLNEVTQRGDYQAALYSSYNKWMADRCADSGGRLRWVVLAPFRSMPDALEEIRFGKEHGACGVYKIGIECDRSANDHYFFPAYQLASDLDLPICVHNSSPWMPVVRPLYGFPQLDIGGMSNLRAAASIINSGIHKRFPALRFGFIEAGSEWLPYVLRNQGGQKSRENLHGMLQERNIFVTCEVNENVGYLVNELDGEDNLIIGTDYCHGDRSAVREAHKLVVSRSDLGDNVAAKITTDNARTFYSL